MRCQISSRAAVSSMASTRSRTASASPSNLASRTLAMISRYREIIARVRLARFEGLAEAVRERVDAIELTAALDEIWQRIKLLNRYVQDEEPWQLSKDEAAADRLDQVLYTLAEGLRVVSVLLHPFVPGSAERLLAALGREDLSLDGARLGAVGGGGSIAELGQLFPRVEPPERSAA